MGADPIAAIGALDGAIHYVHTKDTRNETRAAVASRLETIPNERTTEPAWNYVAVGTGHPDGVGFWSRFASGAHGAPRPGRHDAVTAPLRPRPVRIGMVGSGFMAREHSAAYRLLPLVLGDAVPPVELVRIAGGRRVHEVGPRYGWREIADD
jgi:hypothetical protein